MNKLLFKYLLFIGAVMVSGCKSNSDKNKEDPNKAPMFRPIHHSKDSATAVR